MTVLGEKLGGVPVDHSVRLGVVLGALFLKSSRVRLTLLMACERFPSTWTAREKRTWTNVGNIRVMCIGFFLARCTLIRIATTLGYE
jgi:hypothetical protein